MIFVSIILLASVIRSRSPLTKDPFFFDDSDILLTISVDLLSNLSCLSYDGSVCAIEAESNSNSSSISGSSESFDCLWPVLDESLETSWMIGFATCF